MTDLQPNNVLEGVVTNLTKFGAFVDVGVHQDGLVHVSELADRFVEDPRDVVKVGQKLRVRVLEVDLDRKRIALSAKQGGDQTEGGRARRLRLASRKRRARQPGDRGLPASRNLAATTHSVNSFAT